MNNIKVALRQLSISTMIKTIMRVR